MMMNAKQKKLLLIGVALLLLALFKVGLVLWYLQQKDQPAAVQTLNCLSSQWQCALPDGGLVRFVSPPENGKPFVLRLEGVSAANPSIEFAMADMDMGFNRYRFVADGANWKASITLPVCVSGSRSWIATLHLGKYSYRLPFATR